MPVPVRVGRTLRVESGDGEAVCDVEEWRIKERETSWKSYEGTLLIKPRAGPWAVFATLEACAKLV